MTKSLDSVCRVLGYGLDDHVSWLCMNSIGVRTGLPRFLVVYVGIGIRTRRPRILVVYVRYWGVD